MRFFILFSLVLTSLYCGTIKEPVSKFVSSGYVVDLLYKDSKLYSATDAGTVDIFDFQTKKMIKKIKVDKIKDFMGEMVDSKVFSVDEYDGKIMILSQDQKGFSRVHIHSDDKNRLIIDHTKRLSIIQAKYLDSNTLLLALLSNELISYDIDNSKQNYRVQVSGAKFSDFALSKDKSKVIVADESGELRMFDTKSGKNLKTLSGQNVDNIFQISYENKTVITAGQDRRVGVYRIDSGSAYYQKSDFLVYSVGLSPKGKIAAYSSDENNNVTLFNVMTKSTIGKFGPNKATPTNIVFVSENDFLVSTNSEIINQYKIR